MQKFLKLIKLFSPLQQKFLNLGFVAYSSNTSENSNDFSQNYSQPTLNSNFKKFKKYIRKSKYLPFVIVIFIVLLFGFFYFSNLSANSRLKSTLGTKNQTAPIKNSKGQQVLNKIFYFPLKGTDGKELSTLKFELLTAELQKDIVVKGQKATAVQGRTFLILNLKITNDFEKSVEINSRDYVRLTVNNSSGKLAPDIHNDPVEAQAISTKYTRLGFPINEADTNLTLQIGEITGIKENIKLVLK